MSAGLLTCKHEQNDIKSSFWDIFDLDKGEVNRPKQENTTKRKTEVFLTRYIELYRMAHAIPIYF